MIDGVAAQLALRNRALSAVIATTGLVTLTATTTGYSRVAGSFLTDGFDVGMELTPLGFVSNPVDVITGVTALAITTSSTRAAESATPNASLTVGLPALRAWENVDLMPVVTRPYVEDSFVPATSRLLSYPANAGTVEETGLYILRFYGIGGVGIGATRHAADRVKLLFAPGTTFSLANDPTSSLRVRADVAPSTGQARPVAGGWVCIALTIPWRAFSQNVIAA